MSPSSMRAPDKIEATRALGFRTFGLGETEGAEFAAIKASGFDAVLTPPAPSVP